MRGKYPKLTAQGSIGRTQLDYRLINPFPLFLPFLFYSLSSTTNILELSTSIQSPEVLGTVTQKEERAYFRLR